VKITNSMLHSFTLGAVFWYLISPGRYLKTEGHHYACNGVMWFVPATHSHEMWRNWLTGMGPFDDRANCEQERTRNAKIWNGYFCVPETDPRVDADIAVTAHFPKDKKTGKVIYPRAFLEHHPELVKPGININRPCPPGISPPPDLVDAHREAERRREQLEKARPR